MRPLVFIGLSSIALALSAGCEKQRSTTPAREVAPVDPYAGYTFPPIADDWGHLEYTQVRDALLEIHEEQPELLLTLAGPKGDVLARVGSGEAIAKAIADAPDLGTMFALADAVTLIYKIYWFRVSQGHSYGPEYLLLTTAMVRSCAARLSRLIDETTMQADPVRRQGLLKMRYDLAAIYLRGFETSLQIPTIVDPHAAVDQLGAVAPHVAPFMLPDEREQADQYLTALADLGLDATRVAATRAAIVEAAMHPFVETHVDEARAFSDEERQREQLHTR